MPAIVLPPKVFKTLAPAIKGLGDGAQEVHFEEFINVFTRYGGCSIRACKNNAVVVIPPKEHSAWPFTQRGFKVYKPSNSRLNRQDLQRLRKVLHSTYGWDQSTFSCGSRPATQP